MHQLPAVQNAWPDNKCAKAFWSQQETRPYRQLLADTIAWCDPAAGDRWLDLGCGSGPLSQALWERSGGAVSEILGLDCAPVNELAYERLRAKLVPAPGSRLRFGCHNFSEGLSNIADATFDHVVSGLSISYAESFSQAAERWTDDSYNRVLGEVFRVLRPGGRFVFSVNVPEPKWWRVGLLSLGAIFHSHQPLIFLKRAGRMMRYGRWLKREARIGRFHYLPAPEVISRLEAVGFERVEYRKSYAGQAFIFRATKSR
jgi:ubiquinone/menaquinone biosynthesis C-methylase UbiE